MNQLRDALQRILTGNAGNRLTPELIAGILAHYDTQVAQITAAMNAEKPGADNA